MLRYFLLSLILIFPTISFAQIQIGDTEIESMTELFDKKNSEL